MWWLKVALINAFVILNSVCGNPIDKELHNDEIQEEKFQISKSSVKGFKLDEPSTYRLPNDSIPITYDIILTTHIHNGTKEFDGNVKIHLKIVEATNKITLHYKQITIKEIHMWNTELTSVISPNLVFEYIQSHDFLIITLPQTYQPNDVFILEIQYNGLLRDDGAGFYWGNYAHGDEIRFYGATQFEINDARHAMPCYDEPGIRAVMKLTILHHKSYFAIANTNAVSQELQGSDYMITQFAPTPKMQTYLLAFAISDFEYVNATGNSRIPQRVFGIPSAIQEGQGDFAASVVGDVLKKLEEVLGVDYPLDKMDHIGLTKFNFGAMENFGLITYIDRGLWVSPALSESSKFNQQSSVISLIAHEYAHQWFGDIVSPQWWSYTWLNEGFATLFANYIPHLLYPNRNFMRNFFTSTMPTAFARDGPGSWSMNHYTEDPDRLWDKFGGIGYQKSGCVLRMFMEVLTTEVFLKGLNIYLETNSMSAVTPTELHNGLQEAYNQTNPRTPLNINQLMGIWENQPGYPLISVSTTGEFIVFSQRRYPETNGELYAVPLTLATKTNPDFATKTPKQWLNNAYITVPQSAFSFTPNDWIVVNIDQVGYYRVDYDTTLWRAVISQLNNKHDVIPPINRALLLDEFFLGLTEFNRVTGTDALKIISYFDKEDEAIVWGRAQQTFNYLNDNLFGTSIRVKFLEMTRKITGVHRTELGYEGMDGEDPDRSSLRSYIKLWNCKALDGACVLQEYQKLQTFLNGGNYGNIELCSAMRLIDLDGFNKAINVILSYNDQSITTNFKRNIGCTLDSGLQIELLKFIGDFNNNLSISDRDELLSSMYRNSELGLNTTLSFINGNYEDLVSMPNNYQMMLNIASGIKQEPAIITFRNILNNMRNENMISNEEHQEIMKKLSSNIMWMSTNYAAIVQYFEIDENETTMVKVAPTTTSAAVTTPTEPITTTTNSPPTVTTDSARSNFVSFILVTICVVTNLFIRF